MAVIRLKYICSSFSTPLTQDEIKEEGRFPVFGASGLVGYSDVHYCSKPYLGIIKDGAGVGRISQYPEKSSLLGTMAYIVPTTKVSISWLKYAIISLELGKDVSSTTIPHIYFKDYGNRFIPDISIDKQCCIAEFLDRRCAEINQIMEQTRETVEEYKRLKQSIITEAVTHGVRGPRKMKDSGVEWIGEIPEEWKLSKIKVGVTKVGSGKTPSGGAEAYTTEGVLFLRSQNVYDTGLVLENPVYITLEMDDEMQNTRVLPEDVLLNITGGSIGRCCIVPKDLGPANVNQHVSIIRVKKEIFFPEFMHYYWLSKLGNMAIQLYQTGGNREGMTADAIKNSPIPIPKGTEQIEIVAYLDHRCAEIDRLIDSKQQLLTELESYKKSVIYEYVTGKREVPQ